MRVSSPSDESRKKALLPPAGRGRGLPGTDGMHASTRRAGWPRAVFESSGPIGGQEALGLGPGTRDVQAQRIDKIAARSWSGPSKALQFHLDLYDKVSGLWKYALAHVGQAVAEDDLPFGLLQRIRLLSSSDTADRVRKDGGDIDQAIFDAAVGGLYAEYEDLALSETHYVSHSVMASVQIAAESADPEPIFPTDLPCPRGLIVFESPLMLSDVGEDGALDPDTEVPVRAISWATHRVTKIHDDGTKTEGDGIRYVLYNSFDSYDFEDAEIYDDKREENIPKATRERVIEASRELGIWVIETSGWSFGSPWGDGGWIKWDDMPEGQVHSSAAVIRRFLLAYFRWTWQRIIVPTTYRPKRPEMKRGLRGGLTMEDGYIKVLRLRREVEHTARFDRGEESDEFTFDHQFMVRGHWRRQWYKSLGPAQLPDGSFNPDSHRLVWIEPFIKGNPYGPLIIGHDVSAAVR